MRGQPRWQEFWVSFISFQYKSLSETSNPTMAMLGHTTAPLDRENASNIHRSTTSILYCHRMSGLSPENAAII